MKIHYSQEHYLHCPKTELDGGKLVPPYEKPERMEVILRRLEERGFADIEAPQAISMARLEKIHSKAYLQFLETAWEEWQAAGFSGEIIPHTHLTRGFNPNHTPVSISAKIGYYSFAAETSMVEGSWKGALSSASSAQSAAEYVIKGNRGSFALCRPPGHHAATDLYGGYCFLNNAALAAQSFLDSGAKRVALLDIDFHHGNGSQEIFYERSDVFFASLHGHPDHAFPYFLGFEEEQGEGKGKGFTVNYPMERGTAYDKWKPALLEALQKIRDFGAEALVISLGVDTFENDPISFFKLTSEDYVDCGQVLEKLGLPTVFVMEGGYAVDEIGINVVNVLEGFTENKI